MFVPVISANNNVRSSYDKDKYNHHNEEHINMILFIIYPVYMRFANCYRIKKILKRRFIFRVNQINLISNDEQLHRHYYTNMPHVHAVATSLKAVGEKVAILSFLELEECAHKSKTSKQQHEILLPTPSSLPLLLRLPGMMLKMNLLSFEDMKWIGMRM